MKVYAVVFCEYDYSPVEKVFLHRAAAEAWQKVQQETVRIEHIVYENREGETYCIVIGESAHSWGYYHSEEEARSSLSTAQKDAKERWVIDEWDVQE